MRTKSDRYHFPRGIHFRPTRHFSNSFVIDFAPIEARGGEGRVNFQPHKLKPLLMAPSPELRAETGSRPYPGEITPRCTLASTARQRELHSSMDVVENFECGQTHRQWKTFAIWPLREEFLIFRHMTAAMDTKKVSLFNVPCKISDDERICGLYKIGSNGLMKRGELILSSRVFLSLPFIPFTDWICHI